MPSERQRGGVGSRGTGEPIEADRRLIRDRMARIRKELAQVKRTRGLHRTGPQGALAGGRAGGYTNAANDAVRIE